MAEHTKVQPFYSLSELGYLTDTNRKRVLRMLRQSRIRTYRMGNRHLVFVSEIEKKLPDLWASVVACERVRAITRALEANPPFVDEE